MVDNPFSVGTEEHDLILGNSFDSDPDSAFHTIRYDFKPASVDTTKMAAVEIGEKNQVRITVPNIESSGTSHTVYKGNKRPCAKECLLLYSPNTGTFTLERLSYNIQVKKTRMEGASKAQMQSSRPVTPVDSVKVKDLKNSPSKPKTKKSTTSKAVKTPAIITPDKDPIVSSTSSDSEPESNRNQPAEKTRPDEDDTDYMAMLSKDLSLSESESDDDSD